MPQQALNLEPSGEWLSKSAIAKRCKLYVQTVSSRLEDLGYEADEERSSAKNQVYWFDDEVEFAIKAAKDSLAAMKIRQLRAASEKIEMQNAQARGELVPIGEVTDIIQRITKTVYEEFTLRSGKRIDGQLVKAKNIATVRKIRKGDADRVWKMLRTNFERFIEG
jgi:hypothetical protein